MSSNSIKQTNSPHFWWLVSILSLTIIALVSFVLSCRIACANEIMEYISYASVILSITLSVFAILYTYTSNVQIQQQFEKINAAASIITATSDGLKATSIKLDENLEVILEHLANIDSKQTALAGHLDNINNTNIGGLENRMKSTVQVNPASPLEYDSKQSPHI